MQMITEIVAHTKMQTIKDIKKVNIVKTDYNPQIEMELPQFIKDQK